jgi:hypothetical protein
MNSMLKNIYVAMFLFGLISTATAQERFDINTSHIMRNKGQVKTVKGLERKDVQFVLRANQMQVLISAGKLEYLFVENGKMKSIIMSLCNILPNRQVMAESNSNYTENYYLNGDFIDAVPTVERICYKNIYRGIDWVLYLNKGKLEHEFVVAQGADAQQIKWTYIGADKHSIDKDGNIELLYSNNKIIEKAPQAFTQIGNVLKSKYATKNTYYTYQLPKYNTPYTIDPTVDWATYQIGNDGRTQAFSTAKDNKGHLYIAGVTTATAGFAIGPVHQTANGGLEDGFVSKFDTLGHLIWTTYYGGASADKFFDIQYQNGKLYLAGQSSSSTGIATAGTQQTNLGVKLGVGPINGILIKMDTNGRRIWGTYCGDGSGSTVFNALAIDSKENVYCAGVSIEPTMIASVGSFKDTFAHTKSNLINQSDAILVKYDSSGKRVWGTYIGDTVEDVAQTVAIYNDIVYVGGRTRSQRGIATLGSYKASFTPFDAYDQDVFLIRFDANGNRLWGTYYGGKGFEAAPIIAHSKNGNIYIYGVCFNSDTSLASAGAFQTTSPGDADCFLAKFDTTCKRIWGTYIGSPKYDENALLNGKISVEELGDDGNVWIMGQTRGTGKGIATADAYKDSLNASGKRDAFIGCISPLGKPIYFSYYGGEEDDWANCAFVYNQTSYLVGTTLSTTGIATPGSYKDTYSGTEQASYIVKFAPSKPAAISNNTKTLYTPLEIYPNPAATFINISTTTNNAINSEATVAIINVVGKTVQNQKVKFIDGKLNCKIDFYHTLQPGVYQIVLLLDGIKQSKCFVKE